MPEACKLDLTMGIVNGGRCYVKKLLNYLYCYYTAARLLLMKTRWLMVDFTIDIIIYHEVSNFAGYSSESFFSFPKLINKFDYCLQHR